MLDRIKKVLGLRNKIDFGKLKKDGAIIIDVRTAAEYVLGHIENSKNVPLDKLKGSLAKLPQNKKTPIITCCASGMRSALARNIIKANGYSNVYNGGGWQSLQKKLTQG